MNERLLRWWHDSFWGWVGKHAPAGLTFHCVLALYHEQYYALYQTKGPLAALDLTGEQMVNYAEEQMEQAIKTPERRIRRGPIVIGAVIGMAAGIFLGLVASGRVL